MEKSFKECFDVLCSNRIGDVLTATKQNDTEYAKASDKLDAIREQVKDLIGQDLFVQLDDAYIIRSICETRIAYMQGMRDGLRLNQLVGV